MNGNSENGKAYGAALIYEKELRLKMVVTEAPSLVHFLLILGAESEVQDTPPDSITIRGPFETCEDCLASAGKAFGVDFGDVLNK